MKDEKVANYVNPDADVIIMHATTDDSARLDPQEVTEKVMKTFKNNMKTKLNKIF